MTVVAIFQYLSQRTGSPLLIFVSYVTYAVFLTYLAASTLLFAITVGLQLDEGDEPLRGWRSVLYGVIAWSIFLLSLSLIYVLPFVVVPAINVLAANQG